MPKLYDRHSEVQSNKPIQNQSTGQKITRALC